MTITDTTNAPQPDNEQSEGALRRAYRRWFRRPELEEEPSYDEVTGTDLVPYVPPPRESDEIEPLAWVEKHKLTIPDRRRVKARSKEVVKHLPGMAVKFVGITLPQRAWHEGVVPVWRGCGKCATAYYNWAISADLADAYTAAEGVQKSKHAANRNKSRGYKIWATIIGLCAAGGTMAWLYFAHFTPFLVVLGTLLFLLDVLGRHGTKKKEEIVPVHTKPLSEGMEYGQLTATIQAGLNESIGLDKDDKPLARVSGLVTYDFTRGEFRQPITTYQDFKEEHIRYLERRIAAKPGSMVILQDPKVSTQRIMVVKHRDPFRDVPIAPWVPPKTKSVTEGFLLGVSQTDHPFVVHFAGVHVGIVAKSGGGKSEGVIAAVIEAILACYNAVVVGIDLTEGPLFPIYGDCIQKVAYTPEDADALLDWLLEVIKRRAKILGDIARSDDPNDKGREWNAELAERYNEPSIHIIVDEAPQAVKFNRDPKNDGDPPNLAAKLEIISRTGSKHWVTLVLGSQKTGKSDSGPTGLSRNIMTWLIGPCDQDDANEVFSPELRRAGWAPHLLKPAERGKSHNDAGRVYVSAAGFGPDVYCSWRPMPEEETKRRRKMRLEMGIATCGDDEFDDGIMDAEVVPSRPMLETLAAAFEDLNPPDGRLPSAMAVEWINERTDMELTQDTLAAALRAELGDRAPQTASNRCKLAGNANRKHYTWADIQALMAGS